ncbi:MAG: hypothetical protein ABI954_12195 [Pyrinomonadaceae bacterium]
MMINLRKIKVYRQSPESFMRTVARGVTILGLTLGLGTGFILANVFYRSESERVGLQSQTPVSASLVNTQPSVQKNTVEESLTEGELQQAIESAERDQNNLQLQRKLGLALFHYALLEQRSDLLPDVIRLLERAEQKASSKDKELYQTLGDAMFVWASQKELGKMPLARAAYQKALEVEPKDADLLVSIGLTFFNEVPPKPAAAIEKYIQALRFNPNHEKGLESLTIALIKIHKTAEAALALEKLHQVNPQNEFLDDLQTSLNQQQLAINKLNNNS